jgi:FkbM family methyltransferase
VLRGQGVDALLTAGTCAPRLPGMTLRDRAEARIQAGLHRVDLHMTKYSGTIQRRRQRLLEHTGVTCLLDIGANIGQYASERRQYGYTGQLVSYEPLSGPYQQLAAAAEGDPRWQVERVAVGDSQGEIEIRISDWDIYSSALPILDRATAADPRSKTVRIETAPVKKLDTLADGCDGTLGVKIDVQGFERAVLDGGSQTLARAVYLEMELSMVPVYEGQMLYLEALRRVDEAGFVLTATEPLFPEPATGQAMQMNGLFVRTT